MFRSHFQMEPEVKVMESIYVKGRDNARTPFQWDDSAHAGFTTGEPWIKVNPNYKTINAKQAEEDPNSIYNYYKKIIKLRKENPVVVYGDYQLILAEDESIFAYTRTYEKEKLLVVTNFSRETVPFSLPDDVSLTRPKLFTSNYKVDEDNEVTSFNLRPYEARVYKAII